MRAAHFALIVALATTLPAFAAAEPPPHQINVRLTGLFADYEVEPNGLIFTIIGAEFASVWPGGWTIEAQGEALVALAGVGWASTVRGGKAFVVHGDPRPERTWFGRGTPFAGLRFGAMPYPGTSDGYALTTTVLGPQFGGAYDLTYGGRGFGFTARTFFALNYHALLIKNQEFGWTYARNDPSPVSLEVGVSFGMSYGL